MRITETIDHPATPEQVFELLCSPEFQHHKCEAGGALEQEVSVTEQDGGAVLSTRRRLPTDDFPDVVKGMIGRTVLIVETQDWGRAAADGSRVGTLTVEVEGAPVALNGTLAMAPGGSGTIETVEGDLKANVPLLGGRIEKAAAPAFVAGIRIEARVAREWLTRA